MVKVIKLLDILDNAIYNLSMTNKTYLVEELFHDIPGDPDNIIFQIPPEVCEQAGWKEGDTIHIKAENGQMTLTKV